MVIALQGQEIFMKKYDLPTLKAFTVTVHDNHLGEICLDRTVYYPRRWHSAAYRKCNALGVSPRIGLYQPGP